MIAWIGGLALAGPWTRSAGEYYAKLAVDAYSAPEYRSPVTALPGVTESGTTGFRGEQFSAWVEFGALPEGAWRAQLALSVPVTAGHTEFDFDNGFGRVRGHTTVVRVGDVRLVPQVALHPTAPIAAALELKVPAYRNDSVCRDSPYRIYCPRPGDGQIDLTPSVLAGVSNPHGFAEFSAGWRIRTDWVLGAEGPPRPLGDGPAFAAAGGGHLSSLLLIARVEGNLVLNPDDAITPQAVRLGPAALWTVHEATGTALEARFMADLWSKGTARGVGGGVGVSARR